MSRRRRMIKARCCYELCFRAKEGLPLSAYGLIRLLIGSALARTQRDEKVMLCHDIWNGSHAHIILGTKDGEQCTKFYGEIQKKLTDALKRLLGLDYLDLWEGTPMLAEIADLDAAIDRISYLYANPAQDNLEESIDKFPGYSSWQEFQGVSASIKAESREGFPWIRLPALPKIGNRALSPREDASLVQDLKASAKIMHPLIRHPNAWMSCFGVRDEAEIAEINGRILSRVREREQEARSLRLTQNKTVLGARQLLSQPLLKAHKPKKKSRKIFVITSINELRIRLIAAFKSFCEECRECLERWREGERDVRWPPGAFRPPLPPAVNLIFS